MWKLFQVSVFRAAIFYVLIFVLLSGSALGILYDRLEKGLTQSNDALAWREAAMLTRSFETDDVAGLVRLINQQDAANKEGVYRLSNRLGKYIGGNLRHFPAPAQTRQRDDGWFAFSARLEGAPEETLIRARILPIDNDLVLLVGRDLGVQKTLLADLAGAFIAVMVTLALLALSGASFIAHTALNRIERINGKLADIANGNFSGRLPNQRIRDELATLERHINALLDRIESLMATTREASDNLAHDLRGPLTRLRVRLESLQTRDSGNNRDSGNEVITQGLADIDQLLDIFSAVQKLSRLESGIGDVLHMPVDVGALVGGIADLYQLAFEEAGWAFHWQVPSQTSSPKLCLTGDHDLIGQGLINLLENALAYGGGKNDRSANGGGDSGGATPQLTLSVQEIANGVETDIEISVADCGLGIEADQLAHVRQRFVRLDDSRSTAGNGLGLALVDAICRHHGGQLVLGANVPSGLRASMVLPRRD